MCEAVIIQFREEIVQSHHEFIHANKAHMLLRV